MSGFVVPNLLRKLNALVDLGFYKDFGTLCAAIGKSPETVRWWAKRDGADAPGRISRTGVDPTLAAFSAALPEEQADEIRRLLAGPVEDLEDRLLGTGQETLTQLIDREAVRTAGQLIVAADELSLIRVRRSAQQDGAVPVVPLDADFRIEFETPSQMRYCLALQHTGPHWQIVPSILDRQRLKILIPGLDEDGTRSTMYEPETPGPHRFVALQVQHRLPRRLTAPGLHEVTLDRLWLASLRAHLASTPAQHRRLFALDIHVKAKAP